MRTNTIRVMVFALAAVAIALASAEITVTTAQKSGSLAGTTWQLVKFQDADGTTFAPDDRSKYTITFGSGGRVTVRVDCNRGGTTWKSSGGNQLHFGSWSMTRAKCSPNSLHDRIVNEGASVRSYVIKDGHLFLSGMASGGSYELERR
jgi:para-nitrobenzyl esterase